MNVTTPTQTTLTQVTAGASPAITATQTPTTNSNPYLLGWTSVSAENGTPICELPSVFMSICRSVQSGAKWILFQSAILTPPDSSATCDAGLTFSASSTYAGCCEPSPTGILWTTCESSTVLVGASQVTTCAIGDVCKTDTIYQTAVDGAPTQAIYCGPSTANAETWFRDMPTPGLGKSAAVLCLHQATPAQLH